jgi:NAD(P)-dependent dehydrogenase (short-subunit alcohol dehydrogenase family)
VAGRLAGEVVIVTGSTAGLGKEIARLVASEGALVVVTGRDADRGEAVAATIPNSIFVRADLSLEEERRRLVDAAIDTFGSLTVLVNNAVASTSLDGPVDRVTEEAWHQILQVDLVATARLCALAIPHMVAAGRGSIVNVSSRAAARGTPGVTAYSAAKAGLESLARSITADFARSGIRCNTVRPGYVLHEVRDADMSAERRARLEAQHLTRLTTPTDVAQAVVFLASREAETISGVTLPIDGGSSVVRALTFG